ncbi:DMT family transporter [Pseudalkalibacillus sp. SCS-8]|uniref:DMT family transporter n=1 Tax=Pseudalkalibacillus nanhaiensis TaxID=3115291 RepID=UPI0032DB96EC
MIPYKMKLVSSLYATMSITFWGISFVSTKAVLDKLDPFTLLVVRFGIGSLFLLFLIIALGGKLRIPIAYIPHLIVLGILGVFIHQVFQATALLTIDASSAGWLISFSPIFTVILAMMFLHERMTWRKACGMTVAVFGVLMVTTKGAGGSFDLAMNIGYLLMILSTLNWAVYSVLLKKLSVPIPPLVLTFYMSTLGFVLTIPFLIRNEGWNELALLTAGEWSHLMFLGIFVSGVAYWYWAKALDVLDASQVSVFLYLEPLATLIAAILLLNEKIVIISVLGGLMIIMGVILVNGQLLTFFHHVVLRYRR